MKITKKELNKLSKLIPDYIYSHVTDISVDFLKGHNIKHLILDIDNTLAKHNDQVADTGVTQWIQMLKEEGFGLLLFSNNKKARVEEFAKVVDCPFIASASKPYKKSYKKAVQILGGTFGSTAAVGDQIFTDVWGANRVGMLSILVSPIALKEEFFIKLKRKVEGHFIKKYHKNKENKRTKT